MIKIVHNELINYFIRIFCFRKYEWTSYYLEIVQLNYLLILFNSKNDNSLEKIHEYILGDLDIKKAMQNTSTQI